MEEQEQPLQPEQPPQAQPQAPEVQLPPAPARVLVLGCGISGVAMARWCAGRGSEVTVADTRDQASRGGAGDRCICGTPTRAGAARVGEVVAIVTQPDLPFGVEGQGIALANGDACVGPAHARID